MQFRGLMLLMILMMRKLLEHSMKKIDQQVFRIEKIIKKKGNKLYVKWKGYDRSFNTWLDKKDLV